LFIPQLSLQKIASLSGHLDCSTELSPSEHHSWSFADLPS
jgi:hypothetical protein